MRPDPQDTSKLPPLSALRTFEASARGDSLAEAARHSHVTVASSGRIDSRVLLTTTVVALQAIPDSSPNQSPITVPNKAAPSRGSTSLARCQRDRNRSPRLRHVSTQAHLRVHSSA
ncbi:transcriptional regulator, LysR family protein [Burkholderia humptydooensis MSMB43]|uniref:Transcriptional regulator, LysR family protein n=1 Tax=Burkholderia humptydooensis MSMB43 TaxID=441157 RepID=A0ABN0G8Y0_9BURK|nr:transcriptional regulator, LysR family protein [Burkholderia humptydooensis MSMB43]